MAKKQEYNNEEKTVFSINGVVKTRQLQIKERNWTIFTPYIKTISKLIKRLKSKT